MKQNTHDPGAVHLDLPMEPTSCSRFVTPRSKPEIYPGTRPRWSFCFFGDTVLPVRTDAGNLLVLHHGGWEELARFVEEMSGCPLACRYAVLAVGSNACPARLADPDKFGGQQASAIPVLRGSVEGLVSVYAPRMAAYGSVPSTVAYLAAARSELWLTLLSEKELLHLDKSEDRGGTYDLVEFPGSLFYLDSGIRIGPLSAYYQSRALRDQRTGKPILLDCFSVTGADLPSMNQAAVQSLVNGIGGGLVDAEQKNAHLIHECSLGIPLPDDAIALDPRSSPSRLSVIAAFRGE